MNIFLYIFIFLFTIISQEIIAKPFAIQNSELIAVDDLELWNKEYKNIKSQRELNELLKSISDKYQLRSIEAYDAKNIIKIVIKKAILIEKFDIKMSVSEFIPEIQSNLAYLIMKVDSSNTDTLIERKVKSYLASKGYFNAEIKITKKYKEEKAVIQIIINEKQPCLVRDIIYKIKLPKGYQSDLEVGEICDVEIINNSADSLEEELRDNKYLNSKIRRPEIKYDKKTNSAKVLYSGFVGQITTYEVKNITKKSFINKFSFSDSLNVVDENITDPDSIKNRLIKNYKNEGYNDVTVKLSQTESKSDNAINYIFTVDSGIQYVISSIQVEGLRYIGQKQALDIMGYESIGSINYLNIENLEKAMNAIKSFYISEGFWDFKIDLPRIMKNATLGEARVIFLVNEGKRRILDSIVIDGNKSLENKEIRSMITVERGTAIEWQKIVDFEKALQKKYRDLGFLYLKTEIQLVQSHTYRDIQTKIIITIKEGERVKFGRISIKGNIKTKTDVISGKILFEEGDYYSTSNINKTRESLLALGLFSSINISPTRSYDIIERKAVLAYTITVTESRPGSISFGPGWTFFDGFRFSLDIAYNNLFGTARKVFLKTQYSEETQQQPIDGSTLLGYQFAIGYIEPNIFRIPANMTISLSLNSQATIQSWQYIKSLTLSLDHISLYTDPRYKTSIYVQSEDTSELGASEVEDIGLISSANIHTRRIGGIASIDYRNDIIWPTAGGIAKLNLAKAFEFLNGDFTYFFAGLALSHNFAFTERFVLAVRGEWNEFYNTFRVDSDLNIPPESDRLFSGGATTNRGFREGILGPLIAYNSNGGNQKYYIGGTTKEGYSLEFKYRVIGNLSISTFFDSSNVSLSESEEREMNFEIDAQRTATNNMTAVEDNAPFDFIDIFENPSVLLDNNYSAYGLSLNVLTPLGSMNASYGWPLAPCLNMKKTCAYPRAGNNYSSLTGGVFHINIGATF